MDLTNFFQTSINQNFWEFSLPIKKDPSKSTYKIVFFDSGLGGLSLLRDFYDQRPNELFKHNFLIYYKADQEYFPYGDLNNDKIIERVFYCFEEILDLKPNMYVLACNTATTNVINLLRNKYPTMIFVGTEPYVKFPRPEEKSNIVMLVTPSTYKSQRLNDLKIAHDPNNLITIIPMKNLAKLATDYLLTGVMDEKSLNQELEIVKNKNPDYVLLGCTHYGLIENILNTKLDCPCISPNSAIIKRINHLIENTLNEK